MLETLGDPTSVVAELRRVTKRGGVVAAVSVEYSGLILAGEQIGTVQAGALIEIPTYRKGRSRRICSATLRGRMAQDRSRRSSCSRAAWVFPGIPQRSPIS